MITVIMSDGGQVNLYNKDIDKFIKFVEDSKPSINIKLIDENEKIIYNWEGEHKNVRN